MATFPETAEELMALSDEDFIAAFEDTDRGRYEVGMMNADLKMVSLISGRPPKKLVAEVREAAAREKVTNSRIIVRMIDLGLFEQ